MHECRLALRMGAMLAVTLMPLLGASASSAQEPPMFPPGISMEMLGSYEIALNDDWLDVVLERVPIDPRETLDGRDPEESGGGLGTATTAALLGGAHVLYVESGEVVVASASGERAVQAGESTFEPAPDDWRLNAAGDPQASYDLRNETGACASVLRLSVWVIPRGVGGVPAAPSGPQRGCGAYELLLHDLVRYPWPAPPPDEVSVAVFLARMEWSETAWLSTNTTASYNGPAALFVEAGELAVQIGDQNDDGIRVSVSRGGWVRIGAGVEFMAWAEPGSRVLAMGIVPAATGWSVVPTPPEGDGENMGAAGFVPGAVVRVNDDRVRLRSAPSTTAAIVTILERGAILTVTGPPERRDGFEWYPVADESGRGGFVADDFLEAAA